VGDIITHSYGRELGRRRSDVRKEETLIIPTSLRRATRKRMRDVRFDACFVLWRRGYDVILGEKGKIEGWITAAT
jgi:hypothetical protein